MKIYVITNTLNNKQYVGQTSQPLKKRMIAHNSDANRSTSAIHSAIKKYGQENFYIQELAEADTQEELVKS